MSKSMMNQLLDVVRRIINSTVEQVIQFARSTESRLGLDALTGLARAVDSFLELHQREILPDERQKLRTFCKNASDKQSLATFYKEVRPVFA